MTDVPPASLPPTDAAILAEVLAITRQNNRPDVTGQGVLQLPHEPLAMPQLATADPTADEPTPSSHPLAADQDRYTAAGITWSAELHHRPEGSRILVAGIRCVVHTPPTRSGVRVVFVTLDDPTGLVDLAFFPNTPGHYLAAAMTTPVIVAEGTIKHSAPRSRTITGTKAWAADDWLQNRHKTA